jgi:nicotinate-nucleotide pyrophosphorylase (carboxylating)
MFSPDIRKLVERSLLEDIGPGDLTSNLVVPEKLIATATVAAREELVLSGGKVFQEVVRQVDSSLELKSFKEDGERINAKETILAIRGCARSILTLERTGLNFLMFLSGIATLTRKYVDVIGDKGPVLLDTRKTTPALRFLEKAAVRHGGGKNHRFALFDGILIKDNHIIAAGGVEKALSLAKAGAPAGLKIEIEVDDLTGVKIALAHGADILLLDNMDPPTLKEAVKLADDFFSPGKRKVLLEASGGVTLETLPAVAETGVDFISVGAITHSAKAADIGLDFLPLEDYRQL